MAQILQILHNNIKNILGGINLKKCNKTMKYNGKIYTCEKEKFHTDNHYASKPIPVEWENTGSLEESLMGLSNQGSVELDHETGKVKLTDKGLSEEKNF